MRKICEGVYLVAGGNVSAGGDAMAYLVEGDGLCLIDAGAQASSGGRILDRIVAAGHVPEKLERLLVTHAHVDHIGGISEIVKKTGCRVVCHEGDAEALRTGDPVATAANWYGVKLPPITIDEILLGSEGSLGQIGWIHTPGHTPGSVVFTYRSSDGLVLFGQDIHGPFSPEFKSDKDQWAMSMLRLIDLGAHILCEGHYGVFWGKDEVRDFIDKHLRLHGYPPG